MGTFYNLFLPSTKPGPNFPDPQRLGRFRNRPGDLYSGFGPMAQQGSSHGDDVPIPGTLGSYDNTTIEAAFTYFGQLVDHDISNIQLAPSPGNIDDCKSPIPAATIGNARNARLDLENIYGQGPRDPPSQILYEAGDLDRLFLSNNGHDLPRTPCGGTLHFLQNDDETVMLSQTHVAFARFHNAVLTRIRAGTLNETRLPEESDFDFARRIVCWRYQWIVLREYLPKICLDSDINEAEAGRAILFNPSIASSLALPIEFSAAAFRFGHSQPQGAYGLNFGADGSEKFLPLFVERSADCWQPPRQDLGPGPVSDDFQLDWSFFIDTGAPVPLAVTRYSSKINRQITAALLSLPQAALRNCRDLTSIATRNLVRGEQYGIVSGEEAARQAAAKAAARGTAVPIMTKDQIWAGEGFEEFIDFDTPLWIYLLREAEVHGNGGERLGPLGSLIIAEVIVGILRADGSSILNQQGHRWLTAVDRNPENQMRLVDVLAAAGMRGAGTRPGW